MNKQKFKKRIYLSISLLILICTIGFFYVRHQGKHRTSAIEAENDADLFISKGYQSFIVNGVSFDMIFVQGGTFTMGYTAGQGDDCYNIEKPAHQVTLSNFALGKHEVTQALWKAVMGSNPSEFKGNKLPVETVSWVEIQDFILKINHLTGKQFSLPTEAQWEFAARGGVHSTSHQYSGDSNVDNCAWHKENSESTTHAVGSKAPNELGIYDMSGNVWEWCSDWYGAYSDSTQTNPQGPLSGQYRVLRGGSWSYAASNCCVSNRRSSTPSYRDSFIGFRLALPL